jgi:hypothetical protein
LTEPSSWEVVEFGGMVNSMVAGLSGFSTVANTYSWPKSLLYTISTLWEFVIEKSVSGLLVVRLLPKSALNRVAASLVSRFPADDTVVTGKDPLAHVDVICIISINNVEITKRPRRVCPVIAMLRKLPEILDVAEFRVMSPSENQLLGFVVAHIRYEVEDTFFFSKHAVPRHEGMH